jgi:hypothetical protein
MPFFNFHVEIYGGISPESPLILIELKALETGL